MKKEAIEQISEAQRGNANAWEALLKEIYPSASRHAFSLLRDRDLAQDAVQNALLKVYNNLVRLKDNKAFNSWWRRILTNEIYMLLRLNRRELSGMDTDLLGQKGLTIEDQIILRVELTQAIKRLPIEQQQIILDIDLRGVELKEVAEAYNLPIGTVKSRLFRGRSRLQTTLENYTLKQKESMAMPDNKLSVNDQIYEYLEGQMSAPAKAEFEHQLEQNPALKQELKRHKDFLTLLHSLTGRITLSAEEVKTKVQTVADRISDYEEIVDETYFEQGTPKTTISHIWFRKPDYYRIESSNPTFGEMVIIVKDKYVLSWVKEQKKAIRTKMSKEYMDRMHLSYPESLKQMAENKTSRVLGTEYLHGRPALHVQFTEKVPQLGEMDTHLWMDKDTWMPMVTEYYNVGGELVNRREVKELRINQGHTDSTFELNLPEDVILDEGSGQEVNIPKEVSLEESTRLLGYSPFVLNSEIYKVKHQWVKMNETQGVLITNYTRLGEQLSTLSISQGSIPHTIIPPNLAKEQVEFEFIGARVSGEFTFFDLGAVKNMLVWQYDDLFFSCGGILEKQEILELVKTLNEGVITE